MATNSLTVVSTRRVAWVLLAVPQLIALGWAFFSLPPVGLFDRALGAVVFLFAALATVGIGVILLGKRSVMVIDERGIALPASDVPVPWSDVDYAQYREIERSHHGSPHPGRAAEQKARFGRRRPTKEERRTGLTIRITPNECNVPTYVVADAMVAHGALVEEHRSPTFNDRFMDGLYNPASLAVVGGFVPLDAAITTTHPWHRVVYIAVLAALLVVVVSKRRSLVFAVRLYVVIAVLMTLFFLFALGSITDSARDFLLWTFCSGVGMVVAMNGWSPASLPSTNLIAADLTGGSS